MELAFRALDNIELQGINGGTISSTGVFRYNFIMPTFHKMATLYRKGLFIVPREGDILLSFTLRGNYTHAQFYQYDVLGTIKIIYWEGYSENPIMPFTDGMPLLPIGKPLYIEYFTNDNSASECYCELYFALLDNTTRRKLMEWRDGAHGIKLEHKNSKLYQVYNLDDWSYSPNTLAPCFSDDS